MQTEFSSEEIAETGSAMFLGHPRGLAFLAFTQVWERFSFYGMQALLALYMIHQLLLPGHVEKVVGFTGFRAMVEAVFGPLTTLALASQIFGLYTGLIYMTPLLGAWLGDGVLGQRRTSVLGLLLMAAGHLLMASEAAFLFALLCLLIGAGCVKGNMYAQVGELYRAGDTRRTQAFSIYLIALNVGAFFAPLVCGTLGEVYGWHYGFGVAGIGMLIGVATYLSGWRYLPADRRRNSGPAVGLERADWQAIAAILLTLSPSILIYAATNQAYNLVIVWAEAGVDRAIFGFKFPVTWLLTWDGLMTIVGIALTIPLWRALSARRREPDTLIKLSIGGALTAAAYLLLAAGTSLFALAPAAVVFLYFMLFDFAFAWTDPPTNSFVSRFAPPAVASTMMSLNLMIAFGAPNIVVGWLGRFYEPLGPARFWLLHAAIAAAGGVLALVVRAPVKRLLLEQMNGDEIRV
jgi:POT family proton-dependent oligopeptide transporter